jgi:hypothetical protein
MIQDLSRTLRAILTQQGLAAELAQAQIVFDSPADPFSPTQPTVDLFLYDLRENLELRANDSTFTQTNGQVTITPPPLRLACTYLVTAWPVGGAELPLQEQQLLADVLQVLSRYPRIPDAFLQGAMVGQQPPLPMIALHPDTPRSMSELWTALGNKLRPSLSVTVTISMPVFPPATAPEAISVQTGLEQMGAPTSHEVSIVIAGTITSAGATVTGATVTVVEMGLSGPTDAAGHFRLGPLGAGNYTLGVVSGSTTRTKSITVPAPPGSNYDVELN